MAQFFKLRGRKSEPGEYSRDDETTQLTHGGIDVVPIVTGQRLMVRTNCSTAMRESKPNVFPDGWADMFQLAAEEAKRYDVLQKLAYLFVALVLLPLMLATGLAMSPGMDVGYPSLLDLLAAGQSARTIHFSTASRIVLFVVV